MPTCQENSDTDERKIWKIVPGFLRKKSRNVKQKPPEYQEVTRDNTNKAAFEEAELLISENESESESDKQVQASDNKQHQRVRQSLANRLSWTYGHKASERSNSTHKKREGTDMVEEFPDQGDSQVLPAIRPLQRGESFPGRLAAGTLSKQEARRRLETWRRTTIVRKNSEIQ